MPDELKVNEWTGAWVLISCVRGLHKALGPFVSADEARDACNTIGMTNVDWSVEPLLPPPTGAGEH